MTKRILHIIDQYKIGGPGKTILNSARFIDRNKYDIHVATFNPKGVDDTEMARKIDEKKIPQLKLRDVRGISLENLSRLNSYIKQHNISIFHCHGYKSEFYAYILKLFNRQTTYVTTYHGWITNNWSQKVIVRASLLLSFVIDGIIPVANDLFNKIPRWTKMIRPCRVIHNAIVIEDYKKENHREQIRRKHGIEADDLVLGVIGRMNPEKGCFEAIDSLTHLREMGIHPRLMMIGDGPLKEDLLGYSNKRGVAEQMVFTGHVNPVGPYYAAVDIVVSPSYTEGISNVILEAMACKIPVIATAVGGTPEIITHGVNGLLINPGNAKDISEAVSAIVNNPETTQRMTQAGFTTILENFEFGRRMRKVEKFYEIVLATH